ncbi:MAG: hypothetical protein U1F76_26555 [Candidatus Competibacteraceae bacterium]
MYEIFKFTIKSNIIFPEILPAKEEREADFIFNYCSDRQIKYTDYEWFHQYENAKSCYRVGRRDFSFIIHFPELADFILCPALGTINCYNRSAVPLETIRHLFLDQVFPMVLSERGKTVLHASAVATAVGAIVFLGESGQGKSTLCAAFGQQGFSILTDDCLLLEQQENSLFGIPNYAGLRLWPDTVAELFDDRVSLYQMAHYSSKKRLGKNNSTIQFYRGQAPIKAIYSLISSEKAPVADSIAIEPLGPAESLIELAKHRFCLGMDDIDKLKKDYKRLSSIVKSLGAVYRLDYPRDLSLLPRIVATVFAHSGPGREAATLRFSR